MAESIWVFAPLPDEIEADYMNDYAAGWNDCVAAIRAAATGIPAKRKEKTGYDPDEFFSAERNGKVDKT